mmetsp:Transcript_33108/g.38553  ORF Transcript_33108/g.38553 Transcript_33108/m.38553 type:complete len:251 (+) Transcript_33108:108-860(+)
MKGILNVVLPLVVFEPVSGFLLLRSKRQISFQHRHNTKLQLIGKSDDTNNANVNTGAENFLEKARRLREEVEEIESQKKEESYKKQLIQEKDERQEREEYLRYSAEVPILKSDGEEVMERVQFMPRLKKGEDGSELSQIITVQAPLPLGIILGESEELPGLTLVDEIAEGSNGEHAGVKVGDLLRACTACQVSMEMPTWQLMAGGIGRPKTSRMMFSTDGKQFDEVMGALISNRMDPEGRPVWLVLERFD